MQLNGPREGLFYRARWMLVDMWKEWEKMVQRCSGIDSRSYKIKHLDTCMALVSKEAMASWLERQARVDLSQWGNGGTKSVQDLLDEVLKGESELRSDGSRVVRVAKVRIHDGGGNELINTLQVLSNGQVKERNRQLSEKFGPFESPVEAATRGICEELGSVLGSNPKIRLLGPHVHTWEEVEVSTSYPNLFFIYQLHMVDARG